MNETKVALMSKLTMKQKLFCFEYIKDFNLTQAAIRAGYSKRSAQMIGSDNLSKPIIQQFIGELAKKTLEKVEIDGEMITKQLAKIGFADINDFRVYNPVTKEYDYKPLDEVDGTMIEDIVTVELKGGIKRTHYKLKDSLKAMDLLAKVLKLYAVAPLTNNNTQIVVLKEFE